MEAAEHSDLSNRFFEYFEILPADSEALRQEAFKIRYEAFFNCLRLQTEDHPNSQEKDAYDADALHSLLYHRPSGVYAGTLRLIVPKPNDDAWRFHIERVAGRHFYNPVMPSSLATRPAIGEISRFCLSRQFRVRQGEWDRPEGLPDMASSPAAAGERRTLPHPILGLVAAAIRMSRNQGMVYWYAMMEPGLERRLKQFGLEFHPISDLFYHYGPRRAYLAHLPRMLDQMRKTHPQVWHLLTGGGAMAFPPDGAGPELLERYSRQSPLNPAEAAQHA
ncbi:PEP-CTERM/exosortase system-associated acyltransferase [Methylogaea oryzae]|uniref:PEP-CTERM/exosortase system-associated acyltransferase n=1 Tax=Methylogaea oryzae TaxID=1295382 RepID=A0A8D4VNG9_9GAMM|nr:PEP-CTERM/exosortase system-associated acyltransferase [Methylogaea oryzae]BBL71438.1 hypothetical protein MoryE10_20440 [Methylogaea oryzae]